MKEKFELLAPGGDKDAIKAAIIAGANAIYCGLDKFNARNRAANITFDDLHGIVKLAHMYNCEIFITLNIIITEREIPAFVKLLNRLKNTSIDGVIIQDIGMFYLLYTYFKSINVHASTQATTHNEGQIYFLQKLGVTRINLARELNLSEIKQLTDTAKQNNISTEIFVHGSNCLSISGLCYFSSVHGGNSGNRGRCSQPCRDQYIETPAKKSYPLNLKDNSAFQNLSEIADTGVYSLKIEGRIKKADYVFTVVDTWRRQIDAFYNNENPISNKQLYKVFNRDFTNSFLTGDIKSDMFIDNPRDNSINHIVDNNIGANNYDLESLKVELFDEKDKIKKDVYNKIKGLSTDKEPLELFVSGKEGFPLKILIKTTTQCFEIITSENLYQPSIENVSDKNKILNKSLLLTRFKSINDTVYYLNELNTEDLDNELTISFKELSSIKKKILTILNENREILPEVSIPIKKRVENENIIPSLSVLISTKEDLYLQNLTSGPLYFQLPSNIDNNYSEYIEIFKTNPNIIPWFQSVLIGIDYTNAINFIKQLQPVKIITNNTGIAFEAQKLGIKWIAGPQLNIVNSYSLQCLKDKFNCVGAFISNELNKDQIKSIVNSEGINLHYSIFHPIVLMTSRQCLFHQVTGCEKQNLDKNCLLNCKKSATITNLQNNTFHIEKSEGNYHHIYNNYNFLNLDIIDDIPNIFSEYMVDLRDINTDTKTTLKKDELVLTFNKAISGDKQASHLIKKCLLPISNTQYKKGI